MNVDTRRFIGDQIEVFKILNGYEGIERDIFSHLRKIVELEDMIVTLVKDQCRLDIRKYSLNSDKDQ